MSLKENILAQFIKHSLYCFPTPSHFLPPQEFVGELQLLILYSNPGPQVTEHPVDSDHWDQLPSTV